MVMSVILKIVGMDFANKYKLKLLLVLNTNCKLQKLLYSTCPIFKCKSKIVIFLAKELKSKLQIGWTFVSLPT